MNIQKIIISTTFTVLYYFGIILLSIIPVLVVINLEYESQRHIFEDILGGDAGIGGYGVLYLFYLTFIFAFFIFSIIAFIIINKIMKKYSYKKMIIITGLFVVTSFLLIVLYNFSYFQR